MATGTRCKANIAPPYSTENACRFKAEAHNRGMEHANDARYQVTWVTGEKTVKFEQLVRMQMQRPRWWEWRQKRECRELEALAACYGLTIDYVS